MIGSLAYVPGPSGARHFGRVVDEREDAIRLAFGPRGTTRYIERWYPSWEVVIVGQERREEVVA